MPSYLPDPDRDGSWGLVLPNGSGKTAKLSLQSGATPKIKITTAGFGFQIVSAAGAVLLDVTESGIFTPSIRVLKSYSGPLLTALGPQTFLSFTVPANSLSTDGDCIVVDWYWISTNPFGGSCNLSVNGSSVAIPDNMGQGQGHMTVIITRAAQNSQNVSIYNQDQSSTNNQMSNSTLALDDSQDITVNFEGNSGASLVAAQVSYP